MDPVLDLVRAANPASEDEFAGRANFAALDLARPRRRRRLLAVPALGAVLAAVLVLPNSAPQASEILKRATQVVAVDDGILYARSHAQTGPTGGPPTWSGSRQVWVRGNTAMRWLEDDGAEEVYAQGDGTTRRDADGTVKSDRGLRMVPTEVFRASGLLREAEKGANVKLVGEETVRGRDAYVLRWNEPASAKVTIEMTMWVDKETYAPLRFSDHSSGTAVDGKPFDQTYTEDVLEFKRLADTPENRRLLELS